MGMALVCMAVMICVAVKAEFACNIKAAAAAANLNQLAKLRSKLRQLMQYSTLMDAQRFTRNIENAYRSMWKKWSEKN